MYKPTLLVVLLVILSTVTGAQDSTVSEPSPFMRAMALVPNIPLVYDSTQTVSYADFQASALARGVEQPENWAEFEESLVQPHILFSIPQTAPARMVQYLRVGGPEYQTLLGFDFFDIRQSVEIGSPPANGQIIIGDIDPAQVILAFTARGYTAENRDGGTLLCPANGCDSGLKTNLSERNPANPFGGELGRSEVAFVADGVLLNSASLDVINALISTYAGNTPSLATVTEVQAIDAMLADYPYVSAVALFNPLMFGVADIAQILSRASQEAIDRLLEDLDIDPLPLYLALGAASVSSADAEYGLTFAVYGDAETAATAAGIIDTRLTTGTSLMTARSYVETFTGGITTLEPVSVVDDEATGRSIVVARIVGDTPPLEAVEGRIVWSHIPFSRFINAFYARDTTWLLWSLPE